MYVCDFEVRVFLTIDACTRTALVQTYIHSPREVGNILSVLKDLSDRFELTDQFDSLHLRHLLPMYVGGGRQREAPGSSEMSPVEAVITALSNAALQGDGKVKMYVICTCDSHVCMYVCMVAVSVSELGALFRVSPEAAGHREQPGRRGPHCHHGIDYGRRG